MAEKCVFCDVPLEKKYGKWQRRTVLAIISPESYSKLAPLVQEETKPDRADLSKKFLCMECVQGIQQSAATKKKSGRKRRWTVVSSPVKSTCGSPFRSPLLKKALTAPPARPKCTKAVVLNAVSRYFERSHYLQGLRILVNRIPAAKSALVQLCSTMCSKERIIYLQKDGPLLSGVDLQSLADFSFSEVVDGLERDMPLSSGCISGLFPNPSAITTYRMRGANISRRPQHLHEAVEQVVMRKGLVMAIALHTASPRRCKFVQTTLGVDMWRQGSSQKLFQTLNKLGICLSADATRSHVDRLSQMCTHSILEWKQNIEGTHNLEICLQVEDTDSENADEFEEVIIEDQLESELNEAVDGLSIGCDIESTSDISTEDACAAGSSLIKTATCMPAMLANDGDQGENGSRNDDQQVPAANNLGGAQQQHVLHEVDADMTQAHGYSVCWDNVQLESHRKHRGVNKGDHFHMWAMTFGIAHRVDTLHMMEDDRLKAKDLPPDCYLPSPDDYSMLRQHMVIQVARTLVKRMTTFEGLAVPSHIVHGFVEEMTTKSSLVNLGVDNVNPSTTQGALKVMERMQLYTPVKDGKMIPMLAHGDGKSFEMIVRAHKARTHGVSAESRLQGLLPSPQEFHKEMLLLQDFMNNFYKTDSEACRGTIAHIRNMFGHGSLKKEVKDNFQHAWDIMELTTEAYILLNGMEEMGIDRLDTVPADFPDNARAKRQYVVKVARQIVDGCWGAPTVDDVRTIEHAMRHGDNGAKIFPFCSCFEDKREEMVLCCSYICRTGWLHISCAQLEEAPEDDFFCSPECRADGTYIYCYCHQRSGGPMVQCALRDNCRQHEWYHVKCLKPDNLEDPWYCGDDCALGSEQDDPVQAVSRGILWNGLNLLVRRDAVRHGDGEKVVLHWKMDLVDAFWKYGHCHYFKIAHRFLSDVGGFQPERIRMDLIWNRFANLKGKVNSNLPLDLVNEFINGDFKELLKRSRGRYTDTQVDRCARMCGAFGKEMDRLFFLAGMGAGEIRGPNEEADWYARDVIAVTQEYAKDHLFAYMPGREHQGFEGYRVDNKIRAPASLGSKLTTFSTDLDVWEQLAHY